jgi:general secretion pathway protein D
MRVHMPAIRRNRLVLSGLLIFFAYAALVVPAAAHTRKGDKYLAQGKEHEARQEWDAALDLYEKALAEDPADPLYQLSVNRARFQASAAHVQKGLKLRKQGLLGEALLEFEAAYRIDPSLSDAEQEIRTTQEMIEREKKKGEKSTTRGLTPDELARKESEQKIDSMLPVPELKPLNQQPITLKMTNQPARVLYETVGKLAGINVLFDQDFLTAASKPQSIELSNATLSEALDYLGIISKSFWKPLSPNTIFVTQDSTTKRRDYEEQVMRVFYLTNVTTPQELQEIVTAVRSVCDLQKLFVYNAQNAIVARGEADKIALAEKIIHDLDKPKSEVIVDVLVLQASSDVTKTLGAGIGGSGGLSLPINFAPRTSITTPSTATSTTSPTSTTTPTTSTTTTTTPTSTTGTTSTAASIPLAYIGKVNTEDFSTVLPSALLQALLSDSATRVLQSPEIRSVDNQKASLKVGEKEPIASGSFQPGVAGVGINPLVNTQFTFIDVGVNVDLTPKVHDNGEISMHVEVEISSVVSTVDLGGIQQPVISQEKVIHDIRMKDGEVNLLGGLKQSQNSTTLTGIPGLSSIPVIKWLFSTKTVENTAQELLIALIPHIVRRPDYSEENLRTIAVGNGTFVKLNYAPRAQAPAETPLKTTLPPVLPPGASAPPSAAPPATQPAPGATPPATAPPATAPPATAPPQGNAAVNFVPPQITTTVASPFTVNLVIQNATDLFSAPMQIKFDPKMLHLSDVTQGDLLSSDGQQVTFTKNIQNDTGEADITLSRLPGSGGITGSGIVVTLSFSPAARGNTSISVPSFTPVNSQGQAIANSSPLLTVTIN